MRRFNLLFNGIEYVQDSKDKKKYNKPGGGTVTQYDLYELADKNNLELPKRIQRNE